MKKIILLLSMLLMSSMVMAAVPDTTDYSLFLFPNNVSTSTEHYGGVVGVGNNTDYSMDFDGTDDYLSTSYTINNQDYSYTIWIKPDALSPASKELAFGGNTDYHGSGMSTDNKAFCYRYDGTDDTIKSSTTLTTSQYYMITCVYDTDTNNLSLYLDGSYETSTTSGDLSSAQTSTTIGGNGGTRYFDGEMSDALIFNDELTSGEITTLYNNGKNAEIDTTDANLVYYNPMDGLTDLSGNDNQAQGLKGAKISTNNTYETDGTDDYFLINQPDVDSAFTYSIWVNSDAYVNNVGRNIFERNTGSGNYVLCGWYTISGNNMECTVVSSTGASDVLSGSAPTTNVWEHYVLTYDGSIAKMYRDGSLIDTSVATVTGLALNTVDLTLGARTDTTKNFDGELSGIALFNRSLTSTEISDLYAEGRNYNPFPAVTPTPPLPQLPHEDMNEIQQVGSTTIASTSYQNILSGTFNTTANISGYLSYQVNLEQLALPVTKVTCNVELNGVILDAESNNSLTALGDIKQTYEHSTVVSYNAQNTVNLLCKGDNAKEVNITNANVLIREFHDTVDYNFNYTSTELSGSVSNTTDFVLLLNKTITVPSFNLTGTNNSLAYVFDSSWLVNYNSVNTAAGYLTIDGVKYPTLQRYGSTGDSGSAGYFAAANVDNKTNISVLFYVKGDVSLTSNLNERFLPVLQGSGGIAFGGANLTSTDWTQINNITVNLSSNDNDLISKASISAETLSSAQTAEYRFRLINTTGQQSLRHYSTIGQPGMVTIQNLFTGLSVGQYTVFLEGRTLDNSSSIEVLNSTFLVSETGESDLSPNEFTITAQDAIFSTSVQAFTVSDGLILSTSDGSIEYPRQDNLLNLTFTANNYFNTTVLNHNTSNNLQFSVTPYPWLNVTATDIIDSSSISNFSIECDTYGNLSTTTTSLLYQLTDPINGTDVSCTFYHPDYATTAFNATNISTAAVNQVPINVYTTNSINITFRDESDESLITANITVNFIGDTVSYINSTNTGYLYIDLLAPESYTIRYEATGYAQSFYFFTLANRSFNELTLYMQNTNNTQDVTATVIDENTNVVEGARIKVLAEDPTDPVDFITVFMCETNFEGICTLPLELNSKYYKFVIEYPTGVVKKITDKTYIFDTTISFQVILGDIAGSSLDDGFETYTDMTFNNDSFSLIYNDGSNTVNEVCVDVYTLGINSKTLFSSVCSSAVSGTINAPVTAVNGTTYIAYANFEYSSETIQWDSEQYTYPLPDMDAGKQGVLLVVFVLLTLGFIASWNPVVFLVMLPFGISLPAMVGLIALEWPFLLGLHFVFAALAYMISDRG